MHVLFVGDSTIRYLFLTLVAFLSGETSHGSWKRCTRRCAWHEGTYSSWPEFYRDTSRLTFCDCVREHPCCDKIVENRYVTVEGHALTYLQLFGDLRLKGNWLPGDSDQLRRPHLRYAPRWIVNVSQASIPLGNVTQDVLVWNMGHHRCDNSLDFLGAQLSAVARRTIFSTTIGLHPCKKVPSNAKEVFNTTDHYVAADFWDGRVHLNGDKNWVLARRLWKQIVDNV